MVLALNIVLKVLSITLLARVGIWFTNIRWRAEVLNRLLNVNQ
jgi:hypothetical protein